MEIGKRIKEIRISKGLTLDVLAKRLGYNTRSTVCKIENGNIKLNVEGLCNIAKALEISVDELMAEDIETLDSNEVIKKAEEYNKVNDILYSIYGIHKEDYYDLVVITATWPPEKIFCDDDNIILLKKGIYNSSYEIYKDNYKIAYIQCGRGASNLVDSMLCLTNLNTKKIVYVGDASALYNDIEIGTLVTPAECISFEGISPFFFKKLEKKVYGTTIKPTDLSFVDKIIDCSAKKEIKIMKEKVFCTDSIILEYSHLDEIRMTESRLIEMATTTFYSCLNIMNKQGIAILLVSNNIDSNKEFVEKSIDDMNRYNYVRNNEIAKIFPFIIDILNI